MRFNPDNENNSGNESENTNEQGTGGYAGSLLVAHPTLADPNFRRSVILLTVHSAEEGALGVVLNRPMGKTLGEYDTNLQEPDLANVPLYVGGPVANNQMILVAWKWAEEIGRFNLFFGIDAERAKALVREDASVQLRGFIGHAGWTEGQLEAEIEQGAWLVMPLSPEVEQRQGVDVWRALLASVGPEMEILAREPDDPSKN
ncbi:MAG: YqgE/AlgH family protein [Opitutales bacterium]